MLKAKEIHNRITSIQATQQITKALTMIATTKSAKIKKRIATLLPYTSQFTQIFEHIAFAPNQPIPTSSFLQSRNVHNILITFFTTDRGFCGSLNKQVCEKVKLLYQEYTEENKRVDLLPIGKKGAIFLQKHQFDYINEYLDLGKDLSLFQTRLLSKFILDSYKKNTYDSIILIYQVNTNTLEQKIKTQQLLPLQSSKNPIQDQSLDYIYEPSREAIVDYMIPNIITLNLYQALLKATQAEHTARNKAMSKATDNADTLLKELQIAYNRTRQSSITRQIIEIAASAEALKHA